MPHCSKFVWEEEEKEEEHTSSLVPLVQSYLLVLCMSLMYW